MNPFTDGHQDGIRASALGVFSLIGLVEGAVFKKKALACATWFCGLAALTVWVVYPLTVVRISVGVIVFGFGLVGLICYYREPKLLASESSNRNDRPNTEKYRQAILRGMRMSFKNKLRTRTAKEQKAKRGRDLLEESVRTHLLPALIRRGFEAAPLVHGNPVERKSVGTFAFGLLRRARPDGGVDLVEIQFKTYGRAAFRINAGVAPRDGLMTLMGHRPAEEVAVHWLNQYFETHARPWLRPVLRALGLEPLGAWFSVWRRPHRSPVKGDYEKLALRVAGYVPELELALREGKLGPHMRRSVIARPAPVMSESKP